MEETKLRLAEREFILFESKIRQLKKLKRMLDSLDTEGFEKDVAIIEGKFSDTDNIPKIKRLIDTLKFKSEKAKITSQSKLTQLIEQIFECNNNIDAWSPERLSKEYLSIYEKYNTLPKKEKTHIYATILKLYKKIKQK